MFYFVKRRPAFRIEDFEIWRRMYKDDVPIHNRIGHEEIHEEKRPFLFAGTKSLPYLCQRNGNTNPFCRLNNTRRLLQKSFATYSSTTQTLFY